jgi:eukaryotic-like serine/threonine-protein kinase
MKVRTIDGKYELIRELGRGGMGAVYEARNRHTGALVALKMVSTDLVDHAGSAQYASRFRLEQLVGGAIVSQHVARVLDAGIDRASDRAYLVMELLRGLDLRQLLQREGPLPEMLVLKIASQACLGLQRVHANHVVHRDIKTANLFIAEGEADELIVKVLDFGIAKLREGTADIDVMPETKSQTLLGSPVYMSPEQAVSSRALDARSDLWSLGVVMYEALTGETPHRPQPIGALVLRICSQPPQPIRERRAEVSEELAAVVHRALAIEPEQRFQTANELQQALDALLPNGRGIRRAELSEALSAEPPAIAQAAFDSSLAKPQVAYAHAVRQATVSTTPTRRLDTPIEVEVAQANIPANQAPAPRRPRKSLLQLGASVAAVLGLAANNGEPAPAKHKVVGAVTEHPALWTVAGQLEEDPMFGALSDSGSLICKKSDEPQRQEEPPRAPAPAPVATPVARRPVARPAPTRTSDPNAPISNRPVVDTPREPDVPIIVF